MKDLGLKLVGMKEMVHNKGFNTYAVTYGVPNGGDEIMALAIISAFSNKNILLCATTNRAELEMICMHASYVWGLGLAADRYDADYHMYNHLCRPELKTAYGLVGLLWRDYGEQICAFYCSVEEQKMALQRLVAEEVRNSLIHSIDVAAAQHRDSASAAYFMLSARFYELRGGSAIGQKKYLSEAFKSARTLLFRSIDEALQKVRSAHVIIGPDGYAKIA